MSAQLSERFAPPSPVKWLPQRRDWHYGAPVELPRQRKTTVEFVFQGEVYVLRLNEPLPGQPDYSGYPEYVRWGLAAGITDAWIFPTATAFATAKHVPTLPAWYCALESAIEEQVTYDPEEGYAVADNSAKAGAARIARELYDALGERTPEPYFDVAPDGGVDVYFDFAGNELQVHVPPAGSQDYYLFYRIGGERAVERCSDFDRARAGEILRCVVGMDGLQKR